MNAYQLAQELDRFNQDYIESKEIDDAVNMLRQQASELDKVIPQLVKANGVIENLRIKIAELEKKLNYIKKEGEK
jgi:D-serine dehydratase